eukprot:1161616-Pelagomonas_calceolata.AAC.6
MTLQAVRVRKRKILTIPPSSLQQNKIGSFRTPTEAQGISKAAMSPLAKHSTMLFQALRTTTTQLCFMDHAD